MLRLNLTYLSKMYYFKFFSINLLNFLEDDKPIVLIYLPNVIVKTQ